MDLIDLIPTDRRLEVFPALFYDWLGGHDIARMLVMHHEQGHSVNSLASLFGYSEPTARRALARARTRLRRLGILPQHWAMTAGAIVGQPQGNQRLP